MAENYKHLYQQMKKMVEMYQDEVVPGMRKTIEEQEAVIEELREGFVDYVCSGASDPADYCKNKREECVDHRGWCAYGNKCRGFNPLGERREGERWRGRCRSQMETHKQRAGGYIQQTAAHQHHA